MQHGSQTISDYKVNLTMANMVELHSSGDKLFHKCLAYLIGPLSIAMDNQSQKLLRDWPELCNGGDGGCWIKSA